MSPPCPAEGREENRAGLIAMQTRKYVERSVFRVDDAAERQQQPIALRVRAKVDAARVDNEDRETDKRARKQRCTLEHKASAVTRVDGKHQAGDVDVPENVGDYKCRDEGYLVVKCSVYAVVVQRKILQGKIRARNDGKEQQPKQLSVCFEKSFHILKYITAHCPRQ